MNYLPQYIAEEFGFFRDVDIEIVNDVPVDWTQVLRDVNSGKVHAALGGIWVPCIYKQHRIKDYMAFAKVASRNPWVLLGREPVKDFQWKQLEGKRVLCPGGGGISAYMFLDGCLRENGVDINSVRWIHDFTAGMLFEGFQTDWGDIILLPPHMAEVLIAQGKAYELCDMATYGGPVPWSVYYGLPELMEREDNLAGRFTSALQKGLEWIRAHDAADCVDVLKRNWPNVDPQAAIYKVNRLREVGMWEKTVKIDPWELSHYEGYMVDMGIIDRALDYDEIFDVRPFEYTMSL